MVHTAYDSFELLSDCPTKIEAVKSYGSKLLLGCSDGSLRIYAPDSSDSNRSPTADYHWQTQELLKQPYVIERNISGFSRKPVVSMEVLEPRELLLSLSESLAFHRLPSFETIAVITKAKGA
ncbi:Vam6/Vps39-like protein [Quillaja saponaria]|uniref:Vam6/Vps39-like protein n=1 Tax=Quillaja saponaria TaxID=32244 RepID=A0AAD7P6U5_QUISA|nr:Vam6/Vps39-like protein [Quillaja saponaria]